jgi:23S rRNA (pseudouridine1915-N3)-methyltransferase
LRYDTPSIAMWELKILTVGKLKDRAIEAGVERYASMTGGEWRLVVESVKGSRRSDVAASRREDSLALKKRLPRGAFPVALDAGGRQRDSADFARLLGRKKDRGTPVCFMVGGAYGLDLDILEAPEILSLSPMTLSHEMAVLVLAEQIYRAYSIHTGKPYAK